jgi:hypothetical protein
MKPASPELGKLRVREGDSGVGREQVRKEGIEQRGDLEMFGRMAATSWPSETLKNSTKMIWDISLAQILAIYATLTHHQQLEAIAIRTSGTLAISIIIQGPRLRGKRINDQNRCLLGHLRPHSISPCSP